MVTNLFDDTRQVFARDGRRQESQVLYSILSPDECLGLKRHNVLHVGTRGHGSVILFFLWGMESIGGTNG